MNENSLLTKIISSFVPKFKHNFVLINQVCRYISILLNISQLTLVFFFYKNKEINSIFLPIYYNDEKSNYYYIYSLLYLISQVQYNPKGLWDFFFNWGPPFTASMEMVYRIHNYSGRENWGSYFRLFDFQPIIYLS